MEYTEEIKKEADSVFWKYYHILDKCNALICAIQDRQSVISFAKNIKLKLVKDMPYSTKAISISIEEEIRSLTQQIDYLKSKL